MVDELLAGAIQLFVSEYWNPPWCWYRGHCGWGIHDSLFQVAREIGADFGDYIDVCEVLSGRLGVDVFVWEREPRRTQEQVVDLFQGALSEYR